MVNERIEDDARSRSTKIYDVEGAIVCLSSNSTTILNEGHTNFALYSSAIMAVQDQYVSEAYMVTVHAYLSSHTNPFSLSLLPKALRAYFASFYIYYIAFHLTINQTTRMPGLMVRTLKPYDHRGAVLTSVTRLSQTAW